MNQRPPHARPTASQSRSLIVETGLERLLGQAGGTSERRARSAARLGAGVVETILGLSERHQRVLTFAEADPAGFAARFVRFLAADFAQARERAAHGAVAAAERPAAGEDASYRFGDVSTRLVEDWAGPVAGSTQLETLLRIPRSTLHRWQKRGEVVALRTGGRKHVFPLSQFLDGRPAPGLRDVIAILANARQAWVWLTSPNAALGGLPPLDLLKADDVARVIDAARGSAVAGQPRGHAPQGD